MAGALSCQHCGVSLCPSVLLPLAMSVPAVAAEFRWWQQTWGHLVTLAGFKGGFVLPWGGWDSPFLRLSTEMWPAGLPANTQGSAGPGLGHCALPLQGGKSRAVRRCPGRRDVIAGVGQGVLGLVWGVFCEFCAEPSELPELCQSQAGWMGLHPQIRAVPVP